MEDTVRITTREGIEDTIQTATRDRIEAFGQRITPEGIPTGSHPWESIYSGVKENAAILEKQVIQQEIYIPNRYDSTYGIRATEQQFTREGVETTLETASREGIEEMQEQAMREAAEAMERGRTTGKPNQMHHFATNKSKKYTSQFESIAKKYGLDLDDDWNKELMPHQGRHPYAYHDYVLDNMQKCDRIANGDKTKFLKLYAQMKQKIINNPEMLYKDYWE